MMKGLSDSSLNLHRTLCQIWLLRFSDRKPSIPPGCLGDLIYQQLLCKPDYLPPDETEYTLLSGSCGRAQPNHSLPAMYVCCVCVCVCVRERAVLCVRVRSSYAAAMNV